MANRDNVLRMMHIVEACETLLIEAHIAYNGRHDGFASEVEEALTSLKRDLEQEAKSDD